MSGAGSAGRDGTGTGATRAAGRPAGQDRAAIRPAPGHASAPPGGERTGGKGRGQQ